MIIEKRFGSGAILPDDVVCFRSQNTGKHLDVENDVVHARWNDCGDWQAMKIEREVTDALFSGDFIHLLAHTGKRVEIDGSSHRFCRWRLATGSWLTSAGSCIQFTCSSSRLASEASKWLSGTIGPRRFACKAGRFTCAAWNGQFSGPVCD